MYAKEYFNFMVYGGLCWVPLSFGSRPMKADGGIRYLKPETVSRRALFVNELCQITVASVYLGPIEFPHTATSGAQHQ